MMASGKSDEKMWRKKAKGREIGGVPWGWWVETLKEELQSRGEVSQIFGKNRFRGLAGAGRGERRG